MNIFSSIADTGKKCVICLKKMRVKQILNKLVCSHTFHDICIYEWLVKKPTCPCCRKQITVSVEMSTDSDDEDYYQYNRMYYSKTEENSDSEMTIDYPDHSSSEDEGYYSGF